MSGKVVSLRPHATEPVHGTMFVTVKKHEQTLLESFIGMESYQISVTEQTEELHQFSLTTNSAADTKEVLLYFKKSAHKGHVIFKCFNNTREPGLTAEL